jgi:FtsH-binding integral membrane protein
MADYKARLGATTAQAVDIDQGLRAYMLKVYNYMASGLAITGIVAFAAANTPAILNLLYQPGPSGFLQPTMLAYVAMFSPLAFILVLSFGINRLSASTAQTLFWVFSGVMGLSLAHIFLIYTGSSIARVFFITAGTFGGMSLYGYTTKRDLTRWGSFLIMGLIGIIIASLVNVFIGSSMIQFAVSVIGVIVFVGLTAYDTQRIKNSYDVTPEGEAQAKTAIMGALSLYLNFINLFIILLHLFGSRR